MFSSRINPGEGLNKREIYEVWGDIVEGAGGMGAKVIDAIALYMEESNLAEFFNCKKAEANEDKRPFLILEWESMVAHIDARTFGEHLDVYAILALRRNLIETPDPSARIAALEGWQRRDLQLFQSMIKRAMETAMEALDEGSLR